LAVNGRFIDSNFGYLPPTKELSCGFFLPIVTDGDDHLPIGGNVALLLSSQIFGFTIPAHIPRMDPAETAAIPSRVVLISFSHSHWSH